MMPPTSRASPPVHALAVSLMKASCSLGCKEAICSIIHGAVLGNKEISTVSEPFKHLKQLAESGDKQAMTLLGMVLVKQKKDDEALSWFCAAVGWTLANPESTKGIEIYEAPSQPNQDIDFDGANEALLSIGKLLIRLHPFPAIIAQAQEAFRLAALELDDAEAYFYLSKLTADQIQREDDGRVDMITSEEDLKKYDHVNFYLQKAAASGVQEAWSTLFESSSIQIQQQQQEGKTPRTQRLDMAKEWTVLGKELLEFEES